MSWETFSPGFSLQSLWGWLIYGYFLQSTELGLQRKELKETRETLGRQVEVMERQAADERAR